jgi:glucosamine-6-phosphate deaminase
MNIRVLNDKNELGRSAAQTGAERIRQAIAQRGRANIIVATGASQFEMLEHLVGEAGIDWSRVNAFHLDEYVGLAITHPASFRKYLWERFVRKLPYPLKSFHYLDGEADPVEVCLSVGEALERCPVDVAFIGIGENAHLAFNDPPADFETEVPYLVVELDPACRMQQVGEGWFKHIDEVPTQAISMSVRQILKSSMIVCTVPDSRKAQAVRNAVTGPVCPQVPASILQKHDCVSLFLDPDSASGLNG